ncbi:hypothetical protein HPULCUR_011836 [Helicostylum pulchrum]|uniref:Uncharacterized protein n=1 Tax=Helicostylum pulchrum TaxID=562976 RepID=A0ABP9YHH0_9FUNG
MTRELCLRVKNSIKQHRQGKFGAKMSSILDRNAQKQVVDVRGMVWPNDNDNDEDEEGDDEEEDDLDGKDEKADEEAEEDKHK